MTQLIFLEKNSRFTSKEEFSIISAGYKKGLQAVAVAYKKHLKLLINNGMNKTDLRYATGLSLATIAYQTNSEVVATDGWMQICGTLDCDPGYVACFAANEMNWKENHSEC